MRLRYFTGNLNRSWLSVVATGGDCPEVISLQDKGTHPHPTHFWKYWLLTAYSWVHIQDLTWRPQGFVSPNITPLLQRQSISKNWLMINLKVHSLNSVQENSEGPPKCQSSLRDQLRSFLKLHHNSTSLPNLAFFTFPQTLSPRILHNKISSWNSPSWSFYGPWSKTIPCCIFRLYICSGKWWARCLAAGSLLKFMSISIHFTTLTCRENYKWIEQGYNIY